MVYRVVKYLELTRVEGAFSSAGPPRWKDSEGGDGNMRSPSQLCRLIYRLSLGCRRGFRTFVVQSSVCVSFIFFPCVGSRLAVRCVLPQQAARALPLPFRTMELVGGVGFEWLTTGSCDGVIGRVW